MKADTKWLLKALGGGMVGLTIVLPVEMWVIDYYKDTRPSHYHMVVNASFTPEQYDMVVQAATLWVDGVHDRAKLDITVDMGECPEEPSDPTLCIRATPTRINCPPAGVDKIGCTESYTSWIDMEFGSPVSLSIMQHEMGHLFGIPDMDDSYQGVMCGFITVSAPRNVSPEDVHQYLKFRRQ
jgi:hypothetical protein